MVMLILLSTAGIFCLVYVEIVIVLTLHIPSRLELIMNGILAGRSFLFSCVVCN